jgi:diguanylate cyclase (GGDEF)-like protein/PAS domain S-box-containing protein
MGRLRASSLASLKRRGGYFAAVLFMGPAAAAAIMGLRAVGLVARTPLWVVPAILIGGQALTTAIGLWFERSRDSGLRLHAMIAAHAAVVTAAIYATGWGPALAIGLVLVGQATLASQGSSTQRAVLGWNLSALLVGEVLIALGWAPSLIPVPEVHGLAALTAVGIVFSYRSLRSAVVEKERAAAEIERAAALTEMRERRFRALVQSAHDLVFVVDDKGGVTYASPSCVAVLGYEAEALLGPEHDRLIHQDDLASLVEAVAGAVAAPGGVAEFAMRVRHRDGPWRWLEGIATNLFDDPAVEGVVINARDATARRAAEDAIRHQAMHDPLTGLSNRTLFNDRLEHALSRQARSGGYVAVMIVDLDSFKTINDSLGHLTGDNLLVAVAERFRTSLRDFDTIARLGGDEFAILVEDLDVPDHAGRVAQRTLDALATPLQLVDRDVAIGASVGIALADPTNSTAEQLLSNADAAMYRAKREGKGCYRVFETSMHTAAVEHLELEQALRIAITDGTLTVHYQPVIDTRTGRVSSFEALARWLHPRRGYIPPDIFIPLAEESNLILELGRAVLNEACRQAKTWHATDQHFQPAVAVNASRLQLAHPDFVGCVADALAQADLAPTALIIEVTESVLTDDSGRVIASLDALRRTGIRVAIDDFGTGYSSFAALAELPIDILKIDKRFIDNVTRNHQGRGFVNAIMQLAQTLQLETVAEGVEQPEQRDALKDLGCSHLQGYLHSRPLTPEQTHEYLQNHTATPPTTRQPPQTAHA